MDVIATVRLLQSAVDELTASSARTADQVRAERDRSDAIRAARHGVARIADQVHELIALLAETENQLSAAEKYAEADQFDPERWTQRQEAITAELANDPVAGSAAWLTAAARALLTGRADEVERLVTVPFALPTEASWGPERLGTAPDALLARSLPRIEPLLRYLAAGAPLGDRLLVPGEVRARALVLHARLLAQANWPEAAGLLQRAVLIGGLPEAELLAAQATLARLASSARTVEPEQPLREARGEDGAQAEDAAALARRAWRDGPCAAAAVEMFHAGRGPADERLDRLAQARALVDALPVSAGLEGALDVLVVPVPDEIWLAAAIRAVRDRDPEAAGRLADRVDPESDPLLAAELAELRVDIARAVGEGDQDIADLLNKAGLANVIAGRGQRAIEEYTEARRLVPEHRDAALGLADAIVFESWGKPLRDIVSDLESAVELLDREYGRRPPDAGTSWSLLTYSIAQSMLANQVKPAERALALWRAPLAAARAIAFDPADTRRWVRLSQALSDLACLRAATAVTAHAVTLVPDDVDVLRSRIATLLDVGDIRSGSNLSDMEAALDHLGRVQPDDSDGWISIVRAAMIQLSAAGLPEEQAAARLRMAQQAADVGVSRDAQNLLYRSVRADILLSAGQDERASEDFDFLWQESRLDEANGLGFASRAAVELGFGPDAVSLGEQAVALGIVTVDDYGAHFNHGAALVLTGDGNGVAELESAVSLAATPSSLDDLENRTVRLTKELRGKGSAVDLGGVTRAIKARAAEMGAAAPAPQAMIAAELSRAADNPFYSSEVKQLATLVIALVRAWSAVALSDPEAISLLTEVAKEHPEYPELSAAVTSLAASAAGPSQDGAVPPEPQPIPDDYLLRTYLPVSWFEGLSDPMEQAVISRFLPDARDRLRRTAGIMLPGVNFRDDSSLEPAGFRVVLDGAVVAEGQLDMTRWYIPVPLIRALGLAARAEAGPASEADGPDRFPALAAIPVPENSDPLTALVAWPPAEVVIRRLEYAFKTRHTAGNNPIVPA